MADATASIDADFDLDEIKSIKATQVDTRHMSTEALTLLICTNSVRDLEARTRKEFVELRERQQRVHLLHRLQRAVNASGELEDEIDWSEDPEMRELIDQVRALGFDIPEGKYKFTKDEKRMLKENLKLMVEDLNVLNDLQLQTITRLTNERYEAYQMARSILKPLHEDKINKMRKLSGGS